MTAHILQWKTRLSALCIQADDRRYSVAAYAGRDGTRYAAWFKPAEPRDAAAVLLSRPMRVTPEQAKADAEEHRATLEAA